MLFYPVNPTMTRTLKTSDFLGLAVVMLVGIYHDYLHATDQAPPFWLTVGSDQLVLLSLVAIVTGFAIEAYAVTGRLRRSITVLVIIDQWFLPISLWVGFGTGTEIELVLATSIVWWPCLLVAMLLMAWQAVVSDTTGRIPQPETPTDD
jgi:hypothetical protein